MSKVAYIYGAHVKYSYTVQYNSFEELSTEGQGNGQSKFKTSIHKLVHSKPTQKFWLCNEPLVDDLGFVRLLNVFAEYRRGKQHKINLEVPDKLDPSFKQTLKNAVEALNKTRFDRLCLMNDEVMWQARTGSPLTYRFSSISEAEKFFKWVLAKKVPKVEVNRATTDFKLKIGDKVILKEDFIIKPSALNSWAHWTYYAGDRLRVYNFSKELDAIVPSGEDGSTLIRIPNSGGAKQFIGYGWIPSSKLELIEEA